MEAFMDQCSCEFNDAIGPGGFGNVEASSTEHGPFKAEVFGADVGHAQLEENTRGGPYRNQMSGASPFMDGGTVLSEHLLKNGMTSALKQKV